jgi:excisionase family DNA binding protein
MLVLKGAKSMEKRLLNVPEVAVYLGFSVSAIRKWVRRGSIPFNKVNGGIRFDIERINQWLQKETVISKTQSNYN